MSDFSQNISEGAVSKQRYQNVIALLILAGGLFVGSLFVDLVQLVKGEGFSIRTAKMYDVLETAGKTWVGYSDPQVELQVITDATCSTCDPSEALVWLRRVLPTLEATRVDIGDELGKRYAERYGVVTLPAFLFSKEVTTTSFYAQAASLFQPIEGRYFFDMGKIGLAPGRYLKLPQIENDAIVTGPDTAKVTVVEYSDFECSYCKQFHQDVKSVAASYGETVRVAFKHLPLSIHVQANNAALAAECAHEQGKFDVYSNHLFTKQAEWSKTTGTQKFKDYAWWLKLDYRPFVSCLDSGKYQEKITRDQEEARTLQITATPATFVNGTFLDGAVSTADIKAAIDEALAQN